MNIRERRFKRQILHHTEQAFRELAESGLEEKGVKVRFLLNNISE